MRGWFSYSKSGSSTSADGGAADATSSNNATPPSVTVTPASQQQEDETGITFRPFPGSSPSAAAATPPPALQSATSGGGLGGFRFVSRTRSSTSGSGGHNSGHGGSTPFFAANNNHGSTGDFGIKSSRRASTSTTSISSGASSFLGVGSALARQDAQMERLVANAARELGDGVQKIVLAAKARQGNSEWKSDLLALLGNDPPPKPPVNDDDDDVHGLDHTKKTSRRKADIDVLLENSKCERFVLRCVESELPPNLIHCLRLVRVLELQHTASLAAASAAAATASATTTNDDDATSTSTTPIVLEPVARRATVKVSRLLCLLCKDASVGEQLRPHLFGLLALSGASYPPTGIHVAAAASEVISCLAQDCLTRQLVWFIHDRKMIMHMTDDIKELTGMTKQQQQQATSSSGESSSASTSPSVPMGLIGAAAEQAGLWTIAFSTVIKLIAASCKFQTIDLVKDFEAAGGYKVLRYAITNSPKNTKHGSALIELLPLLTCCPNEVIPVSTTDNDLDSHNPSADLKLAANLQALQIQEDLLYRSNPLLRAYLRESDGELPDPTGDNNGALLTRLAQTSIETALVLRRRAAAKKDKSSLTSNDDNNGAIATTTTTSNNTQDENSMEDLPFDVSSSLLSATLQIFSDHAENYAILEGRQHVLSYYLLAFPCFDNADLKNFILKTLEFVLTGVGVSSEVTPVNASVEIFFALCQAVLSSGSYKISSSSSSSNDKEAEKDDDKEARRVLIMEALSPDAELMGSTLEKLLQFDQRVAPLMVESGIMTTNLHDLLLVLEQQQQESSLQQDDEDDGLPPASTPLDSTFAVLCRVLKLLVAHQPVNFSKDSQNTNETPGNDDDAKNGNQGDGGSPQSQNSSSHKRKKKSKILRNETTNLHKLLRLSIEMLGSQAAHAAAGVFEAYMASFASLDALRSDMDFVLGIVNQLVSVSHGRLEWTVLERQAMLLATLRSILEARSLARDAFRDCGGFQAMIRLLMSMKGACNAPQKQVAKGGNNQVGGGDDNKAMAAFMKLLETIIGLIDASIGIKSRSTVLGETAPLLLTDSIVVDAVSSQLSSQSPAATNRRFIRQKQYYLDLAATIAGTGILDLTEKASSVMDLVLGHVDPSLRPLGNTERAHDRIRNADGIRLVMAIALFLPETDDGTALATLVVDEILVLCDKDSMTTTLPQLAGCAMCWSLTNEEEFGPVLFDEGNRLRSRFISLLCRLAAFGTSYMDFVGTLRCILGPMLRVDGLDGQPRIRLPVITSSIGRKSMDKNHLGPRNGSDDYERREDDVCERLATISVIARETDRYPRLNVGGDSINTIGVLMHQVRLEDRLRAAAEEGRLKFLEIESVDSSAVVAADSAGTGTTANPSSAPEKIWGPLGSSGFSYSVWMRHTVMQGSGISGNLYILDISSPTMSESTSKQSSAFLSVWFDIQNQRFNVMSSASHRGEPICFPVSPLVPNVWHHVLVTYSPGKRTMMSRKSAFSIFVDGRPLEAEVKVDSVNLPPNARVLVGAPNPALATSGIVRGKMPVWELGPILMLATVLLELDATALYAYGPDFPGLLWGDRPQRLSLAATSTALFSALAETGELGSVASALRRRGIPKLEGAGVSTMGHVDNNSLESLNLLCNIPPECVVFGFQPGTCRWKLENGTSREDRRLFSERLVNLARLNFGSDIFATDAVVYGKGSLVSPMSFADSLRWAGGPALLMPIVYKASSARSLSLTLQVIRESCHRNLPNLEAMQAGGGYRMLAVLLQEKGIVDEGCLDQCIAFAIHGFAPDPLDSTGRSLGSTSSLFSKSSRWVLSDLDAMKHLLLNHQIWDLKRCGPSLPQRMMDVLNRLVDPKSIHKAFNARRLHMVGIVRWALHLMIEASELYTVSEVKVAATKQGTIGEEEAHVQEKSSNSWVCEAPPVSEVSAGGDPGNPFLQGCKNLLRRVLTFMLTPGDLEALAEALIYTVSLSSPGGAGNMGNAGLRGSGLRRSTSMRALSAVERDLKMLPGSTTRLYLVRLLEELIVDGVNEIIASASGPAEGKGSGAPVVEVTVQPHAGGVASPNQPYLSGLASRGKGHNGLFHPKHQQAQSFLSAFAAVLTPVWFATLLEGCREEASASAVVRLLVLMLQASSRFEATFQNSGEFAPFVTSVPKFSTCAGMTISLLSQLLGVPILHIHALASLEPEQLCEVFDAECEVADDLSIPNSSDPSAGIFALIAECFGRNLKLITSEESKKAKETNQAVFQLLAHRHATSASFRAYCCTPYFAEPFSQALCLIFDQGFSLRRRRRTMLKDIPKDLTPTERHLGSTEDLDSGAMGMIRLLRLIITDAMTTPYAAGILSAFFCSFPVHASPTQVEVFHLVLIEHCCWVINNNLRQRDAPALVLSNCVGVASLLLDQLICGFSSTETVIESVKISFSILASLTEVDSHPSLNPQEHHIITVDAAHVTRLICSTGLRWSIDRGDEDLQSSILEAIDSNIEIMLLIPSRESKVPTGALPKAPPGSKLHHVWVSNSLSRSQPAKAASYPDFGNDDEAEAAAVAPLICSLHILLSASREDVRSLAISIVVALLRHRTKVMSDLLVIEINHGDHIETVDVVNRGGFRALLAAHEAAEMGRGSGSQSVKRKYESFFDWYEKNHERVQLVFDSVEEKAIRMFPGIEQSCVSIEVAVENEQKLMVLRIAAQGTADRTILGGLERADLAKQCTEKTVEGHTRWKRQGFDDLAFGAMKWKFLLRQLKGAYSVWEGGQGSVVGTKLTAKGRLSGLDEKVGCTVSRRSSEKSRDLVMRWKLDLSEGAERQRRRLLPNYEFHGLYNIDEDDEAGDVQADSSKGVGAEQLPTPSYLPAGSQVEATADLLKDLNLIKYRSDATFDEFDDGDLDDGHTVTTTGTVATSSSTNDGASVVTDGPTSNGDHSEHTDHETSEVGEESSSYELINGLLQTGDHPERSYNVRRCTGLEVTKALLLWCRDAIYVVDGFEQTIGEGMEPKITRVEREQASFNVALRPKDFKVSDTLGELPGSGPTNLKRQTARSKSTQADSTSEVIYQHRSKRISFHEIYSVFRRRYQLQQNALEFFDVHRNGTLIAFDSSKESEEVLSKVLQSKLPNSIFWSSGSFVSYAKFMSNLKTKIQSQWASGKMTNFDFLMQMNSLAGRSFNDLTQYPVFPWIIADYDSEELDLNDPKSFRDLSKPMGGLGEERAKQFQERYEVLASTCETEDDPPPFHYGTHYSCAAYVLYYLMRLEPFSRLALALQGGKFDVADRLFHDIGRSWKSASEENLQDVRELIPEFFYLPDFLENTNNFDFGETQKGKTVHDVTLPKWAKGDPSLFVRMNRKALESTYVSKHLHLWVDLVFGCKQRGQPAVEALNTFVHVTYEGAVDLDAMDDPVQRASTIAQIQNFGQTPKQLDRRPFPARVVVSAVKDKVIDFGTLPALATLTPPLCVVGAPHIVKIRSTMTDTAKLGMTGQSDKAVGDIWLYKGQLIGVGRLCSLIINPKNYCRFGGMNNGVSLHTSAISTRHREVDKLLSIHDGLHRAPITVVKASFNGNWLVTGSVDSTLRVWQYDENRLTLQGTLCGHDGWPIKCIDISTEFGVIVTGCGRGIVILWDLRTLTFVRSLRRHENDSEQAVSSVSINQKNGNILVLGGTHMAMFDINGNLIARLIQDEPNRPSCAVATDCPEWMDQGIVAVSGHLSGEVRLWGLDYEKQQFILRHVMAENPHTSTITVLRVTGTERQDTLLIGDSSGKMSVCKTVQLDSFSPDELDQVIEEVSSASKVRDAVS